ncbi:hypothetical protein ABH309_08600 [Chromobacterium piscinae]|uniref:Uncharacterized protein n=1 Tax=Chromobacterium piscinae TaxID=686831 RepID=A0ABV0H358_9NEIS
MSILDGFHKQVCERESFVFLAALAGAAAASVHWMMGERWRGFLDCEIIFLWHYILSIYYDKDHGDFATIPFQS